MVTFIVKFMILVWWANQVGHGVLYQVVQHLSTCSHLAHLCKNVNAFESTASRPPLKPCLLKFAGPL